MAKQRVTNMAVPIGDLENHAWQRQRVATDIAEEPKFVGDHAYLQIAYLNWADLGRIGKAVLSQFPEAVFFPACYNNRDPRYAPPAEAIVPIYKNIVDCAFDRTHIRQRRITIRWPWANEYESQEPNILAGRVPIDTSLSRWSAHRRIGRSVHIDVRFDGYVRFEDVNGPRGGVDTICRAHVSLSGLPTVVVDARAADNRSAFDAVADLTTRAVRKAIDRAPFRARPPRSAARTSQQAEQALDRAFAQADAPSTTGDGQGEDEFSTTSRNILGNAPRAAFALEERANASTRPSRKSTRKSSNRMPSGTKQQLRATMKTVSSKARATSIVH